jgi:hypothetical protein
MMLSMASGFLHRRLMTYAGVYLGLEIAHTHLSKSARSIRWKGTRLAKGKFRPLRTPNHP